MSKEKEMVPELRFPEFLHEKEWIYMPISKIGDTVNGLRGKKGADFGGGSPYVQYKQVFDKSFIDFSECGKVDIGDNENQNHVQLGDILFTTSSETPEEVGFASVILDQPQETTYLNSFCFILRPNDLEEVRPNFSRYLFHSSVYRNAVSAIAQGSTRYNLSKGSFLKLSIPLPLPQEQQKIADCLSSLDALIAAHRDKLDALREHKKGLMQNLFPQEGETLPRYRFAGFEGAWEEKKLGEMTTKVGSGKTPKGGDKNYVSSGRPFVRSQNIGWGILLLEDIAFINEETHSTFLSSEIELNDVLLNITGASIGRSVIANEKIVKGNVNQHVCIIRTKNALNPVFLNQYLISQYGQRQIDSFQAGGNRQGLNFSQIRSLVIPTPPTKKEQQKIADCLSAVDELMAAQEDRIDQLQEHKRGLMQGLFPKTNG